MSCIMSKKRIAVIAGDGIGKETMPEGLRVVEAAARKFGIDLAFDHFDFSSWDPEPAGSHPKGRSAWGVDDLVGNGWEWTSTVFAPFPGFRAMASYPEYSADFFDGEHMVLKGAT